MDMIEKYWVIALAWFGALALTFFVWLWTTNSYELNRMCIQTGGSYMAGSGTCQQIKY